MAGLVTYLAPGKTVNASEVFAGPWREFRRVAVAARASQSYEAATVEYAIYVMSGRGRLASGDEAFEVGPGSSVTVGLGCTVTFSAAAEGLELFVTVLDVDQEAV